MFKYLKVKVFKLKTKILLHNSNTWWQYGIGRGSKVFYSDREGIFGFVTQQKISKDAKLNAFISTSSFLIIWPSLLALAQGGCWQVG